MIAEIKNIFSYRTREFLIGKQDKCIKKQNEEIRILKHRLDMIKHYQSSSRYGKLLSIETTVKGFEVLITSQHQKSLIDEYNFFVFELDADYRVETASPIMTMYFKLQSIDGFKEIYIQDITLMEPLKKSGRGYGESLMNHLFAFAKDHDVKKIWGHLAKIDMERHSVRLAAFYKKMGFSIQLDKDPSDFSVGMIEKTF